MADYQAIRVQPRPCGFGAEVTQLSLASALPEAVLAEVRRAWAAHSVLWFPDQPLSLEALEAFTLQLGPFGEDPFIEALPEHPHIIEVRREPDEQAVNFGAAWHSDWSFQEKPPSATLLHAKIVPPAGGDTLYADGYRAWESLSQTMQKLLSDLRAVHSASLAYGPSGVLARDQHQRSMKIVVSPEAERTQLHPLVRRHPESGRRALFVNPVYTRGIEGMTDSESQALLGFLWEHMVREEFVYRHRWQPNMLTVWDNRCAMHFAEGGYDGHRRLMHRTTVAGERPAA